MSKPLVEWLAARLGRRTSWRLGRALYLEARGDPEHWVDMKADGEALLQRRILEHTVSSTGKLVVFDIGANVGNWTFSLLDQAAELGLAARLEVHAFEPVPATAETLRRRVAAHPLARQVRVVQQAMSSAPGVLRMFVVGPNEGTNSLHEDPLRAKLPEVEVTVTTVDEYAESMGLDRIRYLKCDAEGHDMEVLLGSRRILAAGGPVACQFEYNLRWIYARHFFKDVFDFAAALPYRIGKVTPRGIQTYRAWHPELDRFFEGNYVLLHREEARWPGIEDGDFDGFNTYARLAEASVSEAGGVRLVRG